MKRMALSAGLSAAVFAALSEPKTETMSYARADGEATVSLVVNGGFEPVVDGKVEGWNLPEKYSFEPGAGRNGSTALRFENLDDRTFYKFPKQKLAIKPGREYRFEAWVRTELNSAYNNGSTICVEWDDENGRHLGGGYGGGAGGTNGWRKLEGVTPMIPPNATNIRISPVVGRDRLGRVWFDDIRVEPFVRPPVGALSVSAYRNTVAAGAVRLCNQLSLTEAEYPSLEGCQAMFVFKGPDERTVSTNATTFARDRAEVELDASVFGMGKREVTFVLLDSVGKTIGRSQTTVDKVSKLPKRRVTFDRFGRTLVNDRPFFPLGMYWANPLTDEDLETYAKGPFNSLMPYTYPSDAAMEKIRSLGLMTCRPARYDDRKLKRTDLVTTVRKYRNHPSLLAWYTNDEGVLSKLDLYTEIRDIIAEEDPDHPAWTVQDKPWQVREFMPSFDVFGLDPYPVPAHPLAMAAEWTAKAREGTYGMRPLWMVPQTFDWSAYRCLPHVKDRAPTAKEISTMTWLCIAEGANGVFYYSFHDLKKRVKGVPFEERWQVVSTAGREVQEKFPILLADPAPPPSAPSGVRVRAWLLDGETHVLAVNGTETPKSFEPFAAASSVTLSPGEHRFFTVKRGMVPIDRRE